MTQKDHSLIYVGCAGWALPRQYWPVFPEQGTHLQRYAGQMNAVEINSSFYRPHRPQTYLRWAQSVPPGFRFSVKMPKTITHERRLLACDELLDVFFSQCLELGESLGCVLIQLPPSLAFDRPAAEAFFAALRHRYEGHAVIEPRHESWRQAQDMLVQYRIGQVAADPSRLSGGDVPGGWAGIHYWRWHGSPRVYYSAYDRDRLQQLAQSVQHSVEQGIATWCIFDNTADGFAVGDAMTLQSLVNA